MHHAAAFLLAKVGRAGATHIEGALQINLHYDIENFFRDLVKDGVINDAGIIDQAVDAAKCVDG